MERSSREGQRRQNQSGRRENLPAEALELTRKVFDTAYCTLSRMFWSRMQNPRPRHKFSIHSRARFIHACRKMKLGTLGCPAWRVSQKFKPCKLGNSKGHRVRGYATHKHGYSARQERRRSGTHPGG